MSDSDNDSTMLFHEMGLDDRVLQAIAELKWSAPTLVQEKAIPLALEGKDILARARTGSGKTAAYAIPLIQKIIQAKQVNQKQCVRAMVMTPTKELSKQAHTNLTELTTYCRREVKSVDISAQGSVESQRALLMEKPDIIIGTPSRILAHLTASNLELKESLEMFAIDEADLLMSFGFKQDVDAVLQYLPKIYQAFMMSATLSTDVQALKHSILHNPIVLKLEEPDLPMGTQLAQYELKCEEDDKYLVLYTLFKLQLIKGKTIIFVNNVDKCYKVKLYLEQFSIPSCILNSELPVNSRCHIVAQFNSGTYDFIIAADEKYLVDPNPQHKHKKKKKKASHLDKESGVSRGIDFQCVSNVVNFDFPKSIESYIHRVGRTARGDNHGSALSLISVKEMEMFQSVEKHLKNTMKESGAVLKPFSFDMEQIEGFRYRSKGALKHASWFQAKKLRKEEIAQEIILSDKLKEYFDDNPRDLQVLQHTRKSHVKVDEKLQDVPDYLIPSALKDMVAVKKTVGDSGLIKNYRTTADKKNKRNLRDPLKSFKFKGLKRTAPTKRKEHEESDDEEFSY